LRPPPIGDSIRQGDAPIRTTKEQALATRSRVIDAALTVFCRKGYGATTLEDIAAEAGLTRGAIYWNFKNKQDLYAAMTREYYAKLVDDELISRAESAASPLEALRNYMFNYNHNAVANPRVREFMEMIRYKTEVKSLPPEILEVQQTMDLTMKAEITDLVDACAREGLLRGDYPVSVLAMSVLSYLNGIESTWMFNPEIFPLERDLRLLIDLFLDSLKPPRQGGA